MDYLEIDGSAGEGGGQMLRSALTLSMVTGTPFCITGIRAKRPKPGLLRQHLTAVTAAADICGAAVDGAALGSGRLTFSPGTIKADAYRFAIGTAGSCTLVLQTIVPALWFAGADSSVAISGGTHNPAAPPADFLMRVWLPLMQRMGFRSEIELLRHGFYPAGGGEMQVRASPPAKAQPLHLEHRGDALARRAICVVAGVPRDVAVRELTRLESLIDGLSSEIRTRPSLEGPGNALMVELEFTSHSELFCAFGERGLPADSVAKQVAKEAHQYLSGRAAVGEYLADQLVLAMALGQGGSFVTAHVSSHLASNLEIIQKFVPMRCETAATESGVLVSMVK